VLRHPRRQPRERGSSLARATGTIYHSAIRPPPPLLHPLDLLLSPISPRGEKREKAVQAREGGTKGNQTRCPRTVQIDVAVVRLLFGPSLSPLGYGVGSPRSRRLLWLLQTLSWSAQRFASFWEDSCCRTYGRVGEFSLLLDRTGETVVTTCDRLESLFSHRLSFFFSSKGFLCWGFDFLVSPRPVSPLSLFQERLKKNWVSNAFKFFSIWRWRRCERETKDSLGSLYSFLCSRSQRIWEGQRT
jgi:hypothetical protein